MSEPITLATKDPNERLAYTWTPQEGDTIASGLSIIVTDGAAAIDGSPTQIEDGATAKFFLVGGLAGETTEITATATMASGDIVEQTIFIPILDSSVVSTSLTLDLVKAHLRIRHSDQDALLQSHIISADGHLRRFLGDGYDVYADEMVSAQLLMVEWLYRPEDKVELDSIHQIPRAVVAIVGPYRTPTVA